jgi:hypothetical protein
LARWITPLRVAALFTALDLIWAVQALGEGPKQEGSNVAMVSLIVWVVLHLPAAALASFLFKIAGALPPGQTPGIGILATLGVFGLAQTFLIVFGLARWMRRP